MQKIILTVAFCVVFVSGFTYVFGEENGVAGVGVLLALLAFRQVHLGFMPAQSFWVMLGIVAILAIGPHAANQVPMGIACLINIACIFMMLVLGCHNVLYFNHATFLLAYLLLYGNDVTGELYIKRVIGVLLGGLWVALLMYRKHRKAECRRSFVDVLKEFCLESTRSQCHTVFNAFGALEIAMSFYESSGSVTLRVINNGFAVLFVILFVPAFDWLLHQIRKTVKNKKDTLETDAVGSKCEDKIDL